MIQRRSSSVLVIIPTLNEEEGIGPTLEELQEVLSDPFLIVVDGNSVDKTVEIARKMGVDVLFQEGKGKGLAMSQAIRHMDSNARYVVFIDADFTYPAEYVPKMLDVLQQNPDIGMVIGNRFNGEQNFVKSLTDPFYVGNRLLAFAQHVMNGIKLEDPLSGLRVVRAGILKEWKPKSESFDVEAEMNFYIERQGYQILEIPIKYRERLGEKKLRVRHGFGIFKRIVSESLTR